MFIPNITQVFTAKLLYVLLAFSLLASMTVNAVSLKVSEQTQITSPSNAAWQQIQAKPGTTNSYYILTADNQILLLKDNNIVQAPVIADTAFIANNIQLTAFNLHPEFKQPDKKGYGIIYTAHIEPSNQQKKKLAANTAIEFDVVITEWQLNIEQPPEQHITRREVIRIGTPDKNTYIRSVKL